jgi:hypothetical protein
MLEQTSVALLTALQAALLVLAVTALAQMAALVKLAAKVQLAAQAAA